MSGYEDQTSNAEAIQAEIEDRLRDLAVWMPAQDVLTWVERIAERMHEELAGAE